MPRIYRVTDRDPIANLLSFVEYVDGHWLWTGSLNGPDKYGVVYLGVIDGKQVVELAHIRAYKLLVGPIPEGKWILHAKNCPFKRCINPEHLRAGTAKDNSEDTFNFGGRGRSKLTDEQIQDIRGSNRPRKELAVKYDLCYHSIMRIQKNRTWKKV